MNGLIFIAAGLVCFRLSRLIADEDGPGFVFRKLRRLPPPKSSVAKGLACPFCVSAWLALFIAAFLASQSIFPWSWLVFWQSGIWGASIIWNQLFVTLSK